MSLTILGVRHHGPGCARSIVDAFNAQPPAMVLIEGPPEADELIASAALDGMTPPVALLLHRIDDAKQAVFYPFAEFSPEWQAIKWALAHGVPVRFMDFPWSHRFSLRDAEKNNEATEPTGDGPLKEEVQTGAADESIRRDPLSVLAEADGYHDSERWWNDRVEERGNATGMFAAILEAMTAVRAELALPETIEERRREAWMRRVIRDAQREILGEIAVVCGAWHAPALTNPPKVSADNELLKNLPKCKVGVTWVRWTHQRLCFESGYGAGISSPGWYEHLWQHRRDAQITARWLTRVGQILRSRDLEASTAQVIDSVRLAEHLAAFRGRPIPGLAEMNESALAVFCQGDRAPLRLIAKELIIGERLGSVPEGIARVPLQQDIEATQKRLRLKPAASQTVSELDLREPSGLERSRFLHRLNLLTIPWGKTESAGGKGTFKEVWRLEWKPEFAIAIIDAARFGNTIESAATGAVSDRAKDASLEDLCRLLENVLLSDLPEAGAALLVRISAEAAQGDDLLRLAKAVPALARLARYGNVRQTDSAAVTHILDGFSARIHAGLTNAVAGIDDDAAAEWHRSLRDYHAALGLLESTALADWHSTLKKLLNAASTHALLAGASTRLLLDSVQIVPEEAARILGLSLSIGEDPARGAAWLEGFLSGQGSVLIHDPTLLPLLEAWVSSLNNDNFLAVLPLVRRTFASFEPAERGMIAQRIGQARVEGLAKPTQARSLHEDRAKSALPTVTLLLGKEMRKTSTSKQSP
jgi:hypothetical protein